MSRGGTPAQDPVALRSPLLCRFFDAVMARRLSSAFRAVRLARPAPAVPEGRPIVVFSNHPSWWDPAMMIVLATRLFPRSEGYGPMEAAALERYGFMKRIGIFGIDPDRPAGAARFLAVSAHVLAEPGRMLWVTAQGRFTDPRVRPVRLRAGVAHLMARLPDVVALPLALDYPFWTESRPEALAAFGPPIDGATGGDARDWTGRLEAALEATADRLTGLAVARDEFAFDTLLAGGAGVGGVYGAWGRLRAAAAGRPYRLEHGDGRR
jgi:1-acyl-sn-glycerol-3-phosphate acyltransferase